MSSVGLVGVVAGLTLVLQIRESALDSEVARAPPRFADIRTFSTTLHYRTLNISQCPVPLVVQLCFHAYEEADQDYDRSSIK